MNFTILKLGVALAVLTYFCRQFMSYRRRLQFQTKNGCKPATKLQQSRFLFGLDTTLQFMSFIKQKKFLKQTSQLFEDTANTFSINLVGTTRIWTIQPENVKTILQATGDDYEMGWIRLKAFQPYLGQSVTTSNGETWAHGRALLRPSFARAQITNLEIYEEHFQRFAALIPNDGSTSDLQKLFSRLTMNVASEIMFGESVNILQPVISKEILELEWAFDKATVGSINRFNMGNLIWLHWDPEYWWALKIIHNYAQQFVSKALEIRESIIEAEKQDDQESGKKHIFIKALAKDTGDRKVLQDQLVSVLIGGRNTTASLLSHLFYLLVRHPNVELRLRMEIKQLGGQVPTYDQLKNMTYLRHVIDETLRLFPPAPLNERQAMHDTFLPLGGGSDGSSPLHVRKGQTVLYHTYAMHRSTELWGQDARQFRPERWEEMAREGKGGSRGGWKFTAFGGGGRVCPGQQLALTETSYIVTRILQTFGRLDNRDERSYEENLGVVLSISGGVLVGLGREFGSD